MNERYPFIKDELDMKYFILIALFSFLQGCLPDKQVSQCGSGESYSSSLRRCIASVSSSGLSIQSSTPTTPFSFPVGAPVPNKSYFVVIKDNFSEGHTSKWELYRPNGTSTNLSFTDALTLVFSNANFPTQGTYTLQYSLMDTSSTVIETRSWPIQVENSATELILTSAPSATVISRTLTDNADPTFSFSGMSAPISETLTITWYLDGVVQGVPSSFVFAPSTPIPSQSVTIDHNDLNTIKLYNLQVVVSGNHGSYDTKTWYINVTQPNLATIGGIGPSPSIGSTRTLIDGMASTDNFCAVLHSPQGVGQPLGISGVRVEFYIAGALVHFDDVFTHGDSVCHHPTINLVSPTIGEFKNLLVIAKDISTGLQLSSTIAPSLTWGLSIRPQNIAPVTSFPAGATYPVGEVPCTATTLNSKTSCSIVMNQAYKFSFKINDDDYPLSYSGSSIIPTSATNTDKYEVVYKVNGTPYACPNQSNGQSSATKFSCAITFDSYDISGPIDPTTASYHVEAVVTDTKKYPAPAFPGLMSNTITWDIPVGNVSRANNLTVITPPVIGPGIAVENQNLVFSVGLNDLDRDNGVVKITRCSNDPAGVASACNPAEAPVSANLTRTTNAQAVNINIPFFLRDDVVTGVADGLPADAYFRIDFEEHIPGLAPNPIAVPEIVTVSVENYNPAPVIAGDSTLSQVPTYKVYNGFPFTIDPGTITDANTYDGNVIFYQWFYDGIAIAEATSKKLIWFPPKGASGNHTLELCVGDNQNNNPIAYGANCTGAWNVEIFNPELALGPKSPIGEEKAIWHDESDGMTYVAYTHGENIYVQKIYFKADGAPVQVMDSIVIQAYPTATSCRPYDLSINGRGSPTQSDIYVSYLCRESADPLSSPKLNVRHIKAVAGKTGFTPSQKSFGFNYNGLDHPSMLTVNNSMTLSLNADNETVISVDSVVSGHKIKFGSYTITVGTDICTLASPCATTTAMAMQLTNEINSSSHAAVYGVVAKRLLNKVTLHGMVKNNAWTLSYTATTASGISIIKNGADYYWTVITNLSSESDLYLYSAKVGKSLSTLGLGEPAQVILGGTGKAKEIVTQTNPADPTKVFLGVLTPSNEYNFHILKNNYTISTTVSQLFGTEQVEKISMSANTQNIFFGAKYLDHPSVNITNKKKLGFVRSDLLGGSQTSPTSMTTFGTGSMGVIDFKTISAFKVSPSSTTDSNGVLTFIQNTHLYIGKLSFDFSGVNLKCSDIDQNECLKIEGHTIPSTLGGYTNKLAVALPVELTLGQAGSTPLENKKKVLPILYTQDNAGSELVVKLLNISEENHTTEDSAEASIPYIRQDP